MLVIFFQNQTTLILGSRFAVTIVNVIVSLLLFIQELIFIHNVRFNGLYSTSVEWELALFSWTSLQTVPVMLAKQTIHGLFNRHSTPEANNYYCFSSIVIAYSLNSGFCTGKLETDMNYYCFAKVSY